MDIKYVDGNVVITIPVSQETVDNAELTSSEKSKLVATTSGFAQVTGGPVPMKLSLNLIAPLPKAKKK